MENLYSGIGKRIYGLRKSHNMTQEQLSESLDITVKHVSAVERGKSSLSLEKMIDLCELFDCTLDYLILGRQGNGVPTNIPSSILDLIYSDDEKGKKLLLKCLDLFSQIYYSKK